MKYGMNLLLWSDHLNEGLLPVLDRLKQLGYGGVELPLFSTAIPDMERWNKRFNDLGLERTAVTIRTEPNNPISPAAKVRAAGIEASKRTLECCQALGVQNLCGPYHSAIGLFSGSGPTADEWKWGVESMRAVAEHAQTCGVMLALEAVNRYETYLMNCMADAVRFVAEVDHPHCRLMYDTFHANIEEKSIAEAIGTVAPYLVHIHISESDRSTPGTAQVNWEESFDTFHKIGYDGWMVVEAFGLALPEITAATKIWRRMYHAEDQLAHDALAFMKDEVQKRR